MKHWCTRLSKYSHFFFSLFATQMIPNADFVVPVEIDSTIHSVYVLKRPHLDEFLVKMAKLYEIVIFTASLSKYADPVIDELDISRVVKYRLFRESCFFHRGSYVKVCVWRVLYLFQKDLSYLGRDLRHCIIVDNSPNSYSFHPNNAMPITSWFSDTADTELLELAEILIPLAGVENVVEVLTAIDD